MGRLARVHPRRPPRSCARRVRADAGRRAENTISPPPPSSPSQKGWPPHTQPFSEKIKWSEPSTSRAPTRARAPPRLNTRLTVRRHASKAQALRGPSRLLVAVRPTSHAECEATRRLRSGGGCDGAHALHPSLFPTTNSPRVFPACVVAAWRTASPVGVQSHLRGRRPPSQTGAAPSQLAECACQDMAPLTTTTTTTRAP